MVNRSLLKKKHSERPGVLDWTRQGGNEEGKRMSWLARAL
jgi:hypothetical protein